MKAGKSKAKASKPNNRDPEPTKIPNYYSIIDPVAEAWIRASKEYEKEMSPSRQSKLLDQSDEPVSHNEEAMSEI